jgi:hypothetical protein
MGVGRKLARQKRQEDGERVFMEHYECKVMQGREDT